MDIDLTKTLYPSCRVRTPDAECDKRREGKKQDEIRKLLLVSGDTGGSS